MKTNSPIIKFLETIANMLIVTFFWLVGCIPIFTIVPSSAALYHTMVKVIFSDKQGHGIFKDFVNTYRDNLWTGFKLTVMVVISLFFVIIGLNCGVQIYKENIFGLLYLVLGIIISLVYFPALIYLPPVLSRFNADTMSYVRLALYFGLQNVFKNVIKVALLAFMVLVVQFFPLAICIVPALYTDLIRPDVEKAMLAFIEANHLQEMIREEDDEIMEEEDTESNIDIDKELSAKRKKGKH